MTPEREKIKRILECFVKLEELFQFSTSSDILNIPKFIADALTTEQKTEYFIHENDNPPHDLESKIEAVNARFEMWKTKFESNPDTKEAYIHLSRRIAQYVERFGYKHRTEWEERINKSDIFRPIFERPKLKTPWLIMPEQYGDFITDLEYHFLEHQAYDDGAGIDTFPKIKADLKKAVANAEAIRDEYDYILLDRLIKQQLKNDTAQVCVFDIPYDRLDAFNQSAKRYL